MSLAGIALLLSAAAASPVADPLEPARRGLVLCDEPLPGPQGETCEGIWTYQFLVNGEILSVDRMKFDLKPFGQESEVEMTIRDRVTVVDGKICSVLAPETIRAARFERAGAAANEPELEAIKETLIEAMAPWMGKEGCSRYVGTGERFTSELWIDDIEVPEFRSEAKWVPADRATLRPL